MCLATHPTYQHLLTPVSPNKTKKNTGKSTLLDLLAYRKTGGFITGEYYIGGQAEKPSSKWCSYVTQVRSLSPCL